MNRNPLDEAARSLREQTQGAKLTPDESDAGLHLVLRGVRTAARRRRAIRLVTVQLCAVFVGFGAWAAGTGKLAQLSPFYEAPQIETLPTPPSRPRRTAAPPPVADVAGSVDDDAQVAVPVPPVEEPPAQTTTRPVTSRRTSVPPQLSPVEPPVAPPLAPPAVDPLSEYRVAYRTQFVDKDLERAVELWSRYLRLGDAVLSVDARFNRAVALARLMRTNEARTELAPFADGEYGGYRQIEAQRILKWLNTQQDKP